MVTANHTNAQDNSDKVVAKVGSINISSVEFLKRYEMAPMFRKQIKRITPSLKLEFLYSLISEKLWAQQAEELGYDTTRAMKFVDEEFEKMFARDAFYHREILDKIKISDEDLIRAYARNSKKLLVNFLFSKDEKEIRNLYNMLNTGVPFDSVLAVRPEISEQKEPEEIVFGQMDEAVQDSLYSLKVGHYTHPILTPDGWYIFRLTNTVEQVFSAESDKENAAETVKKTLEAYQTKKLYRNFYYKFFEDKKVDVNAPLFQSLARKISAVFAEKKFNYKIKDGDPIYLEPDEAIKIENEFGSDSLKMNYIEFKDQPVSLGKFINVLTFEEFNSKTTGIMSIAKLLDATTRKEIENEFLARQAIKEGFQNLPSVQNDLTMWRESYLAQMLQKKFIDSAKINDSEVYNYYLNYNKDENFPEEVNIVEVLTDSPDTVSEVLSELNKGADIRTLAAKYTQRNWTKKQSGEFGFFPVTKFGKIGKIASSMNVGEIFGPLKVPEGYSIFKLIGKRPAKVDTAQPFDKVKDELKNYLALKKEKNAITHYTVKLAEKFGVDIDLPALEKIEVTNLNMFAYRLLGFGGRITAVPLLTPNVDWVKPYLKKVNINP